MTTGGRFRGGDVGVVATVSMAEQELQARRLWTSVLLLVCAQVAVLSLWFSAASVMPGLAAAHGLSTSALAGLATATQLGFVAGALWFGVTGWPDRFDPRRLFFTCALLASGANVVILFVRPDTALAWLSRFGVGAALAGVYPVGLKIAVGSSVKRRGFIVSALVGALTLGSASPHLVALLGGSNAGRTLVTTSIMGALGGALILFTRLGPFHRPAAAFRARSLSVAWTNTGIRRAYLGYFGHMWELYALWGWLGIAASAAAADSPHATRFGSAIAFLAIGAGAFTCLLGGLVADRRGKAFVARTAMTLSGLSGVTAALTFQASPWLLGAVLIVWGATVIPDSPQFSALVADHAPPELAGSLMTFQTAIGFGISAVSVQTVPLIAESVGWPGAFLVIACGPVAGLLGLGRGPHTSPSA